MIAAPLAGALLLPVASAVHADQRDFTLVNSSSVVLTHLYVSPTAVDDWGDDILGVLVTGPGEQVQISFSRFVPGGCGYDILVISQEGAQGKLLGVDLCATETVTFTDA
jgi:hypothetical protein